MNPNTDATDDAAIRHRASGPVEGRVGWELLSLALTAVSVTVVFLRLLFATSKVDGGFNASYSTPADLAFRAAFAVAMFVASAWLWLDGRARGWTIAVALVAGFAQLGWLALGGLGLWIDLGGGFFDPD